LLWFVKSKSKNMFEERDYAQDPWASAMVLHEELSRDRSYTRRYEGMLEWRERPRLLGFANDSGLQHGPFCGAPATWTGNADPWVDQLLLSDTVLSLKVSLSLVPLIMFRFY
jgi:hypothetical protein